MLYRWKELELFTIQTLSNIITFIQFALTPFELITLDSQMSEEELILIINKKFSSIIKFFSTPLDFIRKYNNIIGPIRTMLSALIFNAFILYLYAIFFLPSWRFIVFFLDIFMPGCLFFGIVFISRKYEEKIKIAIILLIIGMIYFIIRIYFFILNILKHKSINWYINCAHRISSVFLSRLKKNYDCQDEITEEIRYQIDQKTTFIQFDEFHFPYKKRVIDFIITIIIWILLLVFIIVGWEKILQKNYKGKQLEDISLISNMITYSLFIGICLRLLINNIWLIKPLENKTFKIFKILHKLAYKGMHFLATISLIPILGIALKSSYTFYYRCGYYYFFDTRSNADSLINYFMKKELPYCLRCSKSSIDTDPSCYNACSANLTEMNYRFDIAYESTMFSSSFYELYLIPIFIFDLFYILFVVFWLRLICKMVIDILVVLPAPTKNIECKYQTLINTIDSASLSILRSYKYKNALYSFSFTEAKLFVYFWPKLAYAGLLPFDYEYNAMFLCLLVSFTSFFITESQIFTLPYISFLHNVVNFFSYLVSGISSFLICLYVCYLIKMKQEVAIFFIVIIVATPILTALITPFFVKKDPLLFPTKFDLLKIQKWDKKLGKIIDFRNKKAKAKKEKKKLKMDNNEFSQNGIDDNFDNDGILFEDEPSVSVSYYNKNDDQREHDLLVSSFDLIKLAPIQIQERLNKINQAKNITDDDEMFRKSVKKLWPKIMMNDECFDNATNEMIHSSSKLINCIGYTNLIRLFNISLIFSSACLGWCLASGIERWQKILSPEGNRYYLRCNMFNNGTFPAFGSY